MKRQLCIILTLLCLTAAHATLPPPTPAQQEAAAAKKAKDEAQAAQDKLLLAASMDAVTARWRTRAASQGWAVHPAVAIAAQPAAGAPAAGTPAATPMPIKSEKLGTAAPSADVKQYPTQAQPANAPPAVVKKDTPKVENR